MRYCAIFACLLLAATGCYEAQPLSNRHLAAIGWTDVLGEAVALRCALKMDEKARGSMTMRPEDGRTADEAGKL